MFEDRASSFAGNLTILEQCIKSYGIDFKVILDAAGLSYKDYQSKELRIPSEKMAHIYTQCLIETKDPTFGLRCANFITPASFHAFSSALIFSKTLHDFCQRLIRFYPLVTTTGECYLKRTEKVTALIIKPIMKANKEKSNLGSDCTCALLQKFVRFIFQPNFDFERVDINWQPGIEHQQYYKDFFNCDVRFEQSYAAVYFRNKDMNVPLPAANEELAIKHDRLVIEFLTKMDKVDFSAVAFRTLAKLLPSGEFSRDKLAESLNMSVSGFRKKLSKENTNYKELLEQVRRQLVMNYLQHEDLSIIEIAYSLGFSDSSNFSRSFKIWFGKSPNEYRKQALIGNV